MIYECYLLYFNTEHVMTNLNNAYQLHVNPSIFTLVRERIDDWQQKANTGQQMAETDDKQRTTDGR